MITHYLRMLCNIVNHKLYYLVDNFVFTILQRPNDIIIHGLLKILSHYSHNNIRKYCFINFIEPE